MYHEVSEIFTGDLPTPVKYFNPQIKEVYKGIKGMAQQKTLNLLPDELKESYQQLLLPEEADGELWRIVKAADKISAYLKCVEELKMGNQEFKVAFDMIAEELVCNTMPEVKYFITVFLPSFSLSLDELNYLGHKV